MKGLFRSWQATDEFIFELREEDKAKKIRKDFCEKRRRKSRKNTAFSNRPIHPIFRPLRTQTRKRFRPDRRFLFVGRLCMGRILQIGRNSATSNKYLHTSQRNIIKYVDSLSKPASSVASSAPTRVRPRTRDEASW